jgi:glycosyltransferase involved in cell wall biosynthesis
VFISTAKIEGLPYSVLEAMACRCPVVLSDIPSHREISNGSDFIRLVSSENIDGFAEAIKEIRNLSPSERDIIGGKCRRLVERVFSLERFLRSYDEIYCQLQKGRK